MFSNRRTHAAIVAAALVAGVVLTFSAAAASGAASGNFSSRVVTSPCASPVSLCTAGTLSGGLKGTFEFTASALITTADTPTTSVVLYTGDITLETKSGELFCKDAGAFRTTGDGAVSSVCTVVGGTGALAGATGTIQFLGTFTTAQGGQGDYRATVTLPGA